MDKPMIPYPFMNMVERAREGEKRYGTLDNSLSNQAFGTADYPCEECGSPVGTAGWSLCKKCNEDYEKRS